MRVLALSIAALFIAVPAFADEAVVVPDDNGRTIVHEHGPFHDETTIIDHRKPEVVPEEHHDVTITPNDGPSSGEVGVDVETHEHVSPRDDD
jgi:inosine-uridine nucleoside N-ribohydrolase